MKEKGRKRRREGGREDVISTCVHTDYHQKEIKANRACGTENKA